MNIENVNGGKCVIGGDGEVLAVIKRDDTGFYLDKKEGYIEDDEVDNYIIDLNKMMLTKHS